MGTEAALALAGRSVRSRLAEVLFVLRWGGPEQARRWLPSPGGWAPEDRQRTTEAGFNHDLVTWGTCGPARGRREDREHRRPEGETSPVRARERLGPDRA